MSIIRDSADIHESEHEQQKMEAARREKDAEKEAYEMEVAALGWAEDAAELWIPAKYPPVKDGEYLTVRSVANDNRISVNRYVNGAWIHNEVWKVIYWLPMPDTK